MTVAGIDQNSRATLTALSNANDGSIVVLWADPVTHRLLIDNANSSGITIGTTTITGATNGYYLYNNNGVLGALAPASGTVTSVSIVTANGISGSVATATTTPAITLTLGAITPTSVNGLTISTTTGILTITNGKTLSTLKTISLTAADDTGVYTLPTGTKTLLATDGVGTSLTGIPYTLTGTANQVVLSAGTGNITFSLPQSIGTASNPQFATIELGAASDTTLARVSAGVISVEGVRVITSAGTTSGTILKNNGTTFVASTETYAAPGTSGNILTSDGTNWTSAATYAPSSYNGTFQKDMTTTTTTTLAHGLGRTPKYVTVHWLTNPTASILIFGNGGYNGSTQTCNYMAYSSGTGAYGQNTDTVFVHWAFGATAGVDNDNNKGTVAVDGTNISITWAKTGSPTGTAMYFVTAF